MFQAGDIVFVEPSAQIDIGFLAWQYVKEHPRAQVNAKMEFVNKEKPIPDGEILYAVSWQEDFLGGHTCQGMTPYRRGQFVAGKHLSLCFEASCSEVITVPQIATPSPV